MNYDCQRPTSRVIQPPGGGSSNIFGGPDTTEISVNKTKDFHEPRNASSNGGEAERSQGKKKPVKELLSQEEPHVEVNSAGEGEGRSKKLSLDSLKSTNTENSSVQKRDSNSEISQQQECQSSYLHNKEVQNRCENNKDRTNCEGVDLKKFSSSLMFGTGERPTTAPCHTSRCTGRSNRSSVFMHSNYPENPNCRPGVRRRPHTAYKPANANTKSSLFCQDKNAPINEVKEPYRKPLSKKSTVFDRAPKQTIPTAPVSKTYQSTINQIVEPLKFLRQKRSLEIYNGSIMSGSSCDVASDSSPPVIMSSDYCVSQLKLNDGTRNSASERGHESIPDNSPGNVIIASGQRAVHLKRQNNKKVNDNFKSEGFQRGSGVSATPESRPPSGLWSSDSSPSLSNPGSTRTSKNFQSQVFASDEPARAPLWSSDFCRSPMRSDKKHTIINKSLSSSIFSPCEEPVRPPTRAVSRSFSSTIFTP